MLQKVQKTRDLYENIAYFVGKNANRRHEFTMVL